MISCTDEECETPCVWNEWSSWSTCSDDCDVGLRTRSRDFSSSPTERCEGPCIEGDWCDLSMCESMCIFLYTLTIKVHEIRGQDKLYLTFKRFSP